jgi:branched-subunit amino acid transport protein AzlD
MRIRLSAAPAFQVHLVILCFADIDAHPGQTGLPALHASENLALDLLENRSSYSHPIVNLQ